MKLIVAGTIVSVIVFLVSLVVITFSVMWYFVGDRENPLVTLVVNVFSSLRTHGVEHTISDGVSIIKTSFDSVRI